MTTETLSAAAGLALSLAASYLPRFSPWYAALDGLRKRQVMAGLLVLSTLVLLAAQCALVWACYTANAETALRALFAALVVNQAAYLMTPKKKGSRHDREEAPHPAPLARRDRLQHPRRQA